MGSTCIAGNGTSAAEVSTLQTLIRNASDPSQAGAFQLGNQVASKCIINTNLEFVASTGWTFHNDSGVYNQANGIDYLGRAREASAFCPPYGLCLPSSGGCFFGGVYRTACSCDCNLHGPNLGKPVLTQCIVRTAAFGTLLL